MPNESDWIYKDAGYMGSYVHLGDPTDPKTVMLHIMNKEHAKIISMAPEMYQFIKDMVSALDDKGELTFWEASVKPMLETMIRRVEI